MTVNWERAEVEGLGFRYLGPCPNNNPNGWNGICETLKKHDLGHGSLMGARLADDGLWHFFAMPDAKGPFVERSLL